MRLARTLALAIVAGAATFAVPGSLGGRGASGVAGASTETRAAGEAASTSATLRATVYFLTDAAAAPVGVRRTVAKRSPLALQSLEALLAGPSERERGGGMISAIPPGARLVSLSFRGRGGTEAIVSLTGLPPVNVPPGRSASVLTRIRVITQVARTLIGLSGIERVRLRVRGQPWDQPTHRGGIVDAPTGYERLLGWSRVCAGQRTVEERALGLDRCFSALP